MHKLHKLQKLYKLHKLHKLHKLNKLYKLHKYVAVQARWERAPLCKSFFAILRLSIAFSLAHIY